MLKAKGSSQFQLYNLNTHTHTCSHAANVPEIMLKAKDNGQIISALQF